MAKKSILITSVGSLSGLALIEALGPMREAFYIVGTNSDPDSPTIHQCDAAYLTPLTAETEAFEAALRDIFARERPDLIFNGRDEEIAALARLSAEGVGAAHAGPAVDQVAMFNDKYETSRFARTHGLPFADTAFTPDEVEALISRCGLPVLAKPRWNGFASRDTFVLTRPEQARKAAARGDLVAQEFINPDTIRESLDNWSALLGIPMAWGLRETRIFVEMVIAPDGDVASLCAVEASGTGALCRTMTLIEDANVETAARRYATALAAGGMHGPLNVQGKRHPDKGFTAFELNARFTGSSGGRALMGVNQVLQMVGLYLPELKVGRFDKTGARVERLTSYREIAANAHRALQTDRYWSARR